MRINDNDIQVQMHRVQQMLSTVAGAPVEMTLHLGNLEYRESNKLIVDHMQIWPAIMAGYTKKDAWNALRLMAATLALSVELREKERGTVR